MIRAKPIVWAVLFSVVLAACTAAASMQGKVWEDLNGNGLQDPNEPGIPNVEVTLKIDGVTLETAITDTKGDYVHELGRRDIGSPYSDYVAGDGVVEEGSAFIEVKLPENYHFTFQDLGDNSLDSDVDTNGKSSGFQRLTGVIDVDAGLIQNPSTATISEDEFAGSDPVESSDSGQQEGLEQGLESVGVVVDTAGFSCRPTFNESNELIDRTPGFQWLVRFDQSPADELIGGGLNLDITQPGGEVAPFSITIEADTSTGEPIAYLSFYDPQLLPGNYFWVINNLSTDSGDNVVVETGGSGEFEIPEQRVNGCKL